MELRLRFFASPPSPAPSRGTATSSPTPHPRTPPRPIQKKQLTCSAIAVSGRGPAARRSRWSTLMTTAYNTGTPDLVDFNWETLGFQLVPTDFMYIMRSSSDGVFTKGELVPYGPIELNPAAAVLNYGQGLLEGLRAHRKEDGSVLLFRPEENALRMRMGADRLCMPAPSVEQFLSGVKQTILANKRWVPPTGKGSLYIRPLLIGSGAILGVAPSPQYTFVVFVCPVGHYFKGGLSPISLLTEEEYHRAAPGGTGDIKTIGNYASVCSAQKRAKDKGHSDVLYLDPVHKKFVEEVSSCNIFMVKDNVFFTPPLTGTILPGITRSIIEVARNLGFQVEECLIAIDELLDADEVFCTGTAVVLSPVDCIEYQGRRSMQQPSSNVFCLWVPVVLYGCLRKWPLNCQIRTGQVGLKAYEIRHFRHTGILLVELSSQGGFMNLQVSENCWSRLMITPIILSYFYHSFHSYKILQLPVSVILEKIVGSSMLSNSCYHLLKTINSHHLMSICRVEYGNGKVGVVSQQFHSAQLFRKALERTVWDGMCN